MVICLQNMLAQWWQQSCGWNQSMYDLTYGPHHDMEPILDVFWLTKNQRLDIPETLKKTKPNTTVLLVE